MTLRKLFAALAALTLSAAAFAQAADTGEFTADAFRAHVAVLADDRMEGRAAGTPGHERAARYVADRFERLGLRPAMADGAWFQPIRFARFRTRGTPTISVGERSVRQGEQATFRPTPEPDIAIEAPAVFVGYGFDAPEYGVNDYEGLDVRGRIVVAFAGFSTDDARGIPSDVGAHLMSNKRAMAAARGAIGLVEIRPAARPGQRMSPAAAAAAGRPGATWVGDDGVPHSDSPGLRFHAVIDLPAARELFSAAADRLDAASREALRGAGPEGFDLGVSVRVAQENDVDGFDSPNVLAVIPGTDPALANDYVLLMAHLDGLGVRDARPDDTPGVDRIRNGAMDNATGVSTLIEVARVMMRDGNRPRRPVLLAAVTAEEIGLLGASYLADNIPVNGRVISVVNLDMPVLTYDFRDVTAFGAEHSTMGPIVARAAARMGVTVSPDPLPRQGLFTRSDHYRFVLRGVPSVFLMTGFANGGEERFTGFLQNEYHSPSDDLSLPFDWEAGARFARLNYLIAAEIANAPEAPRWYEGSYFGDAMGGDRPRAPRPTD